MARDVLKRLKNGERLLCDGAMGTMLFKHGLQAGECPEKLNLDSPEIIENIAKAYFEAGADIILTNTFGGPKLKLAQFNLGDKCEKINIRAVECARHAIDDNAILAASVGPSGGMLEPYGDINHGLMYESFKCQIKAVLSAGVDMIAIETMIDINEAKLAIKAARDLDSSIPLSATMTFDETPQGFHTIMGISVEQAVNELTDVGADIIGSNCGNGIDNMILIAREMAKLSSLPIIIQSNAGLPKIEDGHLEYPETPEFMAERSKVLLEAGTKIIGGCCGTTPEHIAAIRKVIDSF